MSDPVVAPSQPAPAVRPRRDPAATRQRWVERLQRFRDSNLTIAQFCAREGVSVPAFYAQRRLLAAEAPGTADPPALVPVRLAPTTPAPIELILPNGAILRFAAGTDPATIAAVVRQLGGPPC